MKVSESLREIIRRDGRSLYELAKVSGVDSGRLSRFMRGLRTLTVDALDQLAVALHLELRPRRSGKGR
jgi:transcriptional regulator with XRE-family HTH domain